MRLAIFRGSDPAHHPEAAHVINIDDVQAKEGKIVEVHPVLTIGVTFQVESSCFLHLRSAKDRCVAHDRYPRGPKWITASFRLDYQKAGARILLQVLRVHGHGANQEKWASPAIQGIRHERSERKARPLPRKGGEAADTAQMQQGTRPLRK